MSSQPELLEPTRRVSPVIWVVLGVAAAAVLLFFVIVPLFGGDDDSTVAPPPPRPGVTRTPAPTAAPAPAPAAPAETFEQFGSKDPFRPLVTAGAPPASGAAPAGVAPTAPGAGATGAAGGAAPTGGQRVQVLDVFQDGGTTKAQVKVGSTVYTVAPGAVFATNFKLVSISGNCATMLHGDDKFTLCEGEEVIK